MAHTDTTEDTEEEPNSALLLEVFKRTRISRMTRIARGALLLEDGAHGLLSTLVFSLIILYDC